MKIFYYELRKEFLTRSFFVIFVLTVIANIFWMEWDYQTKGGFNEDFVKTSASEKENLYYDELHQRLDGKLTAEKVSYISQEYNRYSSMINDSYSTEYDDTMHTGYVFGDYSLLTVQFYNPIKYLVTYEEQNDSLVNKTKQNISFYKEQNNIFEVEKNSFILKHYKGRAPLIFYETCGWKTLFVYDKSDFFILVLLIIGIMPSFFQERRNGMETIQRTVCLGSRMYVPAKIVTHIFVAVGLEAVFSAFNFLIINKQYGLKGSAMMLYSISEYQYTPFDMSVLDFYFFIVLWKCIGFAIIAIVMTLIAEIVKNTYVVFILIIGFICGSLYLSGFDNGITVVEKIFTMVSPFSLLKTGEIGITLKEINVYGHFIPIQNGIFFVQIVLIMIILAITYLVEKGRRAIR